MPGGRKAFATAGVYDRRQEPPHRFRVDDRQVGVDGELRCNGQTCACALGCAARRASDATIAAVAATSRPGPERARIGEGR
jgi:hypothetical protein